MAEHTPDEFVFFEPHTGEQPLRTADFSADVPQTELGSAYVLDFEGDTAVSVPVVEGVVPDGQPASRRQEQGPYSARRKVLAGLFAVASLAGIGIGTNMIISGLNKDPACTAKANCDPVALPGSTPNNGPTPEATDTPSVTPSEPPSPSAKPAIPAATHTAKPVRTTASPKRATKKPASNAQVAASITLDPATCKTWSPSHPQPAIVSHGKMSVVIDTRYKDGCSPGFYSGATVHEQPNNQSGEVDLGTSFTTAGSIALNSSVVAVDASKCGETLSAPTKSGATVSSSTWLHVQFPGGRSGYIAGRDAGFAHYAGSNAATC